MEITWEVSDGYCGGSAPQRTEIEDENIADCRDIEEAKQYIDACVREDFRNTISYRIDSYNESEIQALIDARKKLEEEGEE